MSKQHNFIYKKLVEDEEDIIGHIAYSLYKSDKIAYISDHKKSNNNAEPSDVELLQFRNICCLNNNLERYRMQAIAILDSFVNDTLAETTKQIESDYIQNQNKHLKSVIEPLKPENRWIQFLKGVGQSILGAFFFALIVAAFQFIKEYQADNHTPNNEVSVVTDKAQQNSDSISISNIRP